MFNRTRALSTPVPPPVDGDEIATVRAVVRTLAQTRGRDEAAHKAINAICDALGFDLSSVWDVDADTGNITIGVSCMRRPDLMGETRPQTVRPGQGAIGRAVQSGEKVVLDGRGLDELRVMGGPAMPDVATAIGVPLVSGHRVSGVLSFTTFEPWRSSPARLELISVVTELLGQALDRITEAEASAERARDMTAINAVLREVTGADDEETAVRLALDTIRREFGWEYGSFWAVDRDSDVLRFSIESGDAGAEFRQVTRGATFAEGIGVAGRAWGTRDLVYEPDLGVVVDCVRAPAAQRAGVRSGVCVPIMVSDEVVGTMDFFATRTIDLTPARREALRNTAFLVSHALERNRATQRIVDAGRELLGSISRVEGEVTSANRVATEAARSMEAAGAIVTRLDASSSEIGAVVRTITGIADQTNLLALNATIEAARAGEAGKGFAVVASEVKDLARETAVATEEVSGKVQAIQSDSTAVQQALEEIRVTVNRIGEAQDVIESVLSEQVSVTRSVLGG